MSDSLKKYYGATPWWSPRSQPLTVEILESGPKVLKFRVLGETHTLFDPLRMELSKDDDVEFVAYKIEHPLKDSVIFIVRTKSGDPLDAIRRAIDRIKERLKEAREGFVMALRKGVENPPFTDAITWKRFLEEGA